MKSNFSPRYWALFIALTVYATMTNAADGWRPSPAQAAAIGQACDGWKPIARGVFMMRADEKSKPKGNNDLHERIIEQIYAQPSSVQSKEMAESLGFQLCVPVISERFQRGELKIKE